MLQQSLGFFPDLDCILVRTVEPGAGSIDRSARILDGPPPHLEEAGRREHSAAQGFEDCSLVNQRLPQLRLLEQAVDLQVELGNHGVGRARGATTPKITAASTPWKPDSVMVGMFGSNVARSGEATARSTTLRRGSLGENRQHQRNRLVARLSNRTVANAGRRPTHQFADIGFSDSSVEWLI